MNMIANKFDMNQHVELVNLQKTQHHETGKAK